MSQPLITTFANEILDKIFGYLVDKNDVLSLCKTHRSFKASGQLSLFRKIQIPAQHVEGSTGRCYMLLDALDGLPHLFDLVETLQIDLRIENAYPYGSLVLERAAIHTILSKLRNLQHLTIFIADQPLVHGQSHVVSDVAQILRHQTTIKQVTINTRDCRLYETHELFSLPLATTLVVRDGTTASISSTNAARPAWDRLEWLSRNGSVKFGNIKAIDYRKHATIQKVRNFAGVKNLEKLRFTWIDCSPLHGFFLSINYLYPIRDTLKELTIMHDMKYRQANTAWESPILGVFTTLRVLRVSSLAFWKGVACSRIGDSAGLVDRSTITHLLPPNLHELELWFEYPTGIFATSSKSMRQFQEQSEQERVRGFGWILALLQSQSLQRIQLIEHLCVHQTDPVQPPDGWPTHIYTPPDMVSQAFLEAEMGLEIEVLSVLGEELQCRFEHWLLLLQKKSGVDLMGSREGDGGLWL